MKNDRSKITIETTGVLNSDQELLLDVALPFMNKNKVKITLTFEDPDPIDNDMQGFIMNNPSFDFLKDPEEDIYSYGDGKPFKYEG